MLIKSYLYSMTVVTKRTIILMRLLSSSLWDLFTFTSLPTYAGDPILQFMHAREEIRMVHTTCM